MSTPHARSPDRLSCDSFVIGWISALPKEAAAARLVLDDKFDIDLPIGAEDENWYTYGRIGSHAVVLGTLNEVGTVPAAELAVHMHRSFPNIKVFFMVGIAGGLPSPEHDIRLGDVVIGVPTKQSSGVVEHDRGKHVAGNFEHTGHLDGPPKMIRAAIRELESQQILRTSAFVDHIAEAISKFGEQHGEHHTFIRPEASQDPLQSRADGIPKVFYGTIASGDSVIKSAEYRQRLKETTGAIAVEMEGAGIMHTVPGVVIRGICNYSDASKNEQWDCYAALAAAALAKELLSYIPNRVIQAQLPIATEVASLKDTMQRLLSQNEQYHQERKVHILSKEEKKCRVALKTTDYESHKNINRERSQDTCRWLLENQKFIEWCGAKDKKILIVTADPGCGKSVLAKALIDKDLHLKLPTPAAICYFFFKDNEQQSSVAVALCALLHQLIVERPTLIKHAIGEWEKNGSSMCSEVDTLWRILKATLNDPAAGNIVLVLDALDACAAEGREKLVLLLQDLQSSTIPNGSPNHVKVLITTRMYRDLQSTLSQHLSNLSSVHLRGEDETEKMRDEIDKVITRDVETLVVRRLNLSTHIRETLESKLHGMDNRTYLWFRLALEEIEIRLRNSPRPELEDFNNLPTSVSEAYETIMSRIENKGLARKIFQIILAARRPFTIDEMAMALGIAHGDAPDGGSGSRNSRAVGLKPSHVRDHIKDWCGLFVSVHDERLYLIHQTAKEYLLRDTPTGDPPYDWRIDHKEPDALLSEVCIKYLRMPDILPAGHAARPIDNNYDIFRDLGYGLVSRFVDDKTRTQKPSSFLDYSSKYWTSHFQASPDQDSHLENALALFDVKSGIYSQWYSWFITLFPWATLLDDSLHRLHPLHVACFCGLASIVESMIQNTPQIMAESDMWVHDAMFWAIAGNQGHIAKLLLNAGAQINPMGKATLPRLPYVIEYCGEEAANLAIQLGANLHQSNSRLGNSLNAACHKGYHLLIELLLRLGVDPNVICLDHNTALDCAVRSRNLDLVQELLDYGADPTLVFWEGTALDRAARSGSLEIVRKLLLHSADPRVQTGRYRRALFSAVHSGSLEIVRELLDCGADPLARDPEGRTVLFTAAASHHSSTSKLVKLFLELGVDPNTKDCSGKTALTEACRHGNINVAKLLISSSNPIAANKPTTAHTAAAHQDRINNAEYEKESWVHSGRRCLPYRWCDSENLGQDPAMGRSYSPNRAVATSFHPALGSSAEKSIYLSQPID